MVSRPRRSLALRVSLLAVAVAVITAVIGGLIALQLVRQASENGARQTLSRLADQVDAEVADAPVRTLLALRALKIDSAVIGARGRVTGTNQTARAALTPAQIQAVLAGRSVSAVQDVDGHSVLVEARPTPSGGFVLVQPRTDALAAADQAIDRLFLALLIACAVAVVLGLLVSRRLVRPLKRTAGAAHALAAGQRDVVVDASGPTEVAEVADALNTLGDSLARSEGRQRQFLMSVSHDVRTPLTAIRGYAESLADGIVDPYDVPRVGAVVLGEARRLDRFLADLLDLARLDADDVRIDITDLEMVALIDATAAAWSARCAAENVPVVVERPPRPLWVYSDPARLRQVLDGLLENALRVVPAGRPIVLATRPEITAAGTAVAVAEIRDGGPGLTDDDLDVAFDRAALFERYRGVRQVGTGLGLAIVHHLVSRLGGTIEAGHAPEGGARFTVRLPAAAARAMA
jgi:two-component system, OmpR family, sensor kinase